jgi:predicted exporter
MQVKTVLLWLTMMLLCSWWAFSHITLRTDMSLFLPEGTAPEQQLLLNEINQGPANRLLIIAIQGGTAEKRAVVSQHFTAQLRKNRSFERVENGAPRKIEVDSTLFKHRYLIGPDHAVEFTASNLHAALSQRLAELKSPFPSPFKELLAADPSGTYHTMLQGWLFPQHIHREHGVWQSKQSDMALLLVQTVAGGLELDQQQHTLAYLSEEFNNLKPGPEYRLIVSGAGAFAVQSRDIIHNESQNLTIIASALIAVLLFAAYRYLPYLLIAALPLSSALLAGAIICQLVFGELHGITLAFGLTLLGVTLDYPIHLFSHLGNAPQAKTTMLAIWKTLRLGVLTTCVAYLVLLTTEFTGLRQLGLFTLTGLITAALTSRFLLPQIFPVPFSPPQPKGLNGLQALLGQHRWPSVILILTAIISLISLVFPTNAIWQDDIATLSPLPQTLLDQDRRLRQQLGNTEPNHLVVIRGEDPEQLLQRSEALRNQLQQAPEDQLLAAIKLPSDFLPSMKKQRLRQQSLPSPQALSERLRQAMEGLPFRESAFKSFIADIDESRTLTPLGLSEALETELKSPLESMIRQGQNEWFALVPLQTEGDTERIEAYLKQLPDVSYLNLRAEISRLVGDFRTQVLQRVSAGSLLMLFILWYGLGSLKSALKILLPIALAILTTVGVLLLSGEVLNLFHVISLMLVLGIGMDYSLFFNRREQQMGDSLMTLHAVSVCALSTAGVFAILASSSIPVLHAIGLTVAIGVVMSYLATYSLSRVIS